MRRPIDKRASEDDETRKPSRAEAASPEVLEPNVEDVETPEPLHVEPGFEQSERERLDALFASSPIGQTVVELFEVAIAPPTIGQCVDELFDDRFEFEDVTSAKRRAAIAYLIEERDPETVAKVYATLTARTGLQPKLFEALQLVEAAIEHLKNDPDLPAMLAFRLCVIDKRFGTLPDDFIRETLQRVASSSRGGSGRLRPQGALAKLIARCNAFGITSEGAAKEKVKDAARAITAKKLGSEIP